MPLGSERSFGSQTLSLAKRAFIATGYWTLFGLDASAYSLTVWRALDATSLWRRFLHSHAPDPYSCTDPDRTYIYQRIPSYLNTYTPIPGTWIHAYWYTSSWIPVVPVPTRTRTRIHRYTVPIVHCIRLN